MFRRLFNALKRGASAPLANIFNPQAVSDAEPGRSESLVRLAELAGIGRHYMDATGVDRTVSEETMRALLAAMKIPATTDAEIEKSLQSIEEGSWRRPVPPVVVTDEGAERDGMIPVTVSLPVGTRKATVILETEEGVRRRYAVPLLDPYETRRIDGREIGHFEVFVPLPGKVGFHSLWIEGQEQAKMSLILAPKTAYLPGPMLSGEKRWGVATMLPELRSGRNWGNGDFLDLQELGIKAARMGAATVGINPIHAMDDPAHQASPYSPTSRIFRSPMWIAPELIPGLETCPQAKAFVVAHKDDIASLREADRVDIEAVYRLKAEIMEILYHEHFTKRADQAERDEFSSYCAAQGDYLEKFATYCVLTEIVGHDFRDTHPEYRDCESEAVKAFAEENRERVDFFKYQQWLVHRQLSGFKDVTAKAGLECGLYGDLAVGVNPNGADAWVLGDCAPQHCSIGVPPDVYIKSGQNWGVAGFTPQALRDSGYKPFVAMLQSAMEHNGIVRIDHAMALKRLFWIPEGKHPGEGAFVSYDLDNMIGVLKLMSHRNKCPVIAEALGTVPEGFCEKLNAAGLMSYTVGWYEREYGKGEARFKATSEYPPLSLAVVDTHDMPPLEVYWNGADFDEFRRLGRTTPEAEAEGRKFRSEERRLMLHSLEVEGLLPEGYSPAEPDALYTPELGAAIHRYVVAHSASRLAMVTGQDITGAMGIQNIPGTSDTDRPDNWRVKLPVPLAAALESSPLMEKIRADLAPAGNSRTRTGIVASPSLPVVPQPGL